MRIIHGCRSLHASLMLFYFLFPLCVLCASVVSPVSSGFKERNGWVKITNVTPWIVNGPAENEGVAVPDNQPTTRQYVFVQVETDEGLTGWGEITTYPGPVANPAICGMLREIRPLLVGQDANRIEAVWQRIFQAFTYVGSRGATTAMISAIDIALWDIKGQALGVPIYELLGGAVRETIPLYTHYGYATSIDAVVQGALAEVRGRPGDQDGSVLRRASAEKHRLHRRSDQRRRGARGRGDDRRRARGDRAGHRTPD